jgi:hypothetical protein
MPPFHHRFLTFLSLAFATVALLSGCDDCRATPCGPPVTIRLNLPPAASGGATVVACHVDACAMATLPAPGAFGSDVALSFPHANVGGSLITRKDGSLQLVVNWTEGRTGDRYTLVVSDAAGTELASLDEVAMFPVASLKNGACLPCGRTTLGDPA